jgi:aminoglycoside phosphotransferase (APT) family kinase protein
MPVALCIQDEPGSGSQQMATVMLPPALADRVELLLGERPRFAQATVGGHSNLVFSVGDVVIKAATSDIKRDDVAREAALLRSLDGLGCAAPTLIGSHIDSEWSVLATIRAEGVPGSVVLPSLLGSVERCEAFGTLVGRLLRTIHAAAPKPVAGPLFERVGLLTDAGARLEALDLEDDETCVELMDAVMHPVHRRGVAFLHGDPGLHNLLIDDADNRIRLAMCVDWELGGWGNALTDLSWLYWTMWFREIETYAWPAFVDAYGRWALQTVGWGRDLVRVCARSQMAILIARTDPGTAVRNIWLERIVKLRTMPVPGLPPAPAV